MYREDNELVYSPSDLNAFLDNECVTWLSRFNVEFPDELIADEAAEATKTRKGNTHASG